MANVTTFKKGNECSIYRLTSGTEGLVDKLIVTTPESRSVCNDPFVVGVDYTEKLETACTRAFELLDPSVDLGLDETSCTVLHILRGGLNFGLRNALNRAYGWNRHSSAFISAQRARSSGNPEDWYITESSYQKVYSSPATGIVFGDVVATGTSLEFALRQLMYIVGEQKHRIVTVVFFTIGGFRSEEIVNDIAAECRKAFPNFRKAVVAYLEGRFDVATPESPHRIKFTGTDLLRSNSQLAPEFLESQYDNPAYPLERCTIYDAGSRAFHLSEYLEDVSDYWTQTATLARSGVTFSELLKERFPEIDSARFGTVDLCSLAQSQLERCRGLQTEV